MAKKKPDEEEVIQDAECVAWEPDKKHHVQIRLEDGGPKKRDGRRGQIVLEDPEASDTIARWLMSAKCRKAEKGANGRRQAYVWIDGTLWTGASEEVPDADAPETALAVAGGPSMAETETARAYLAHLLAEIRLAEKELEETRRKCTEEIGTVLGKRNEEIKVCTEQIEKARARLKLELEREDEELEALALRRAAAGEDRSAMALQLAKDVELFSGAKQVLARKLLQEDKSLIQQVAEFLQTPIGGVVGMGVASKLGIPAGLLEALVQGPKPLEEKPSE